MRYNRVMNARSGQSLVELLVAIGVGAILVIGAVAAIAPSIQTHGSALKIQMASALGKELLDNTRAFGEGSWHNLEYLSTTSVHAYYLIATTSPFQIATGTQNVTLATSTFTRYFYLDDVYRNSSGKIDSAGTYYDPSTKKITVVYGWGNGTSSLTSYFARTGDNVWSQTDWSGGPNQDGPITATGTNAQFASSTGIDYTTSTGAIVISGF